MSTYCCSCVVVADADARERMFAASPLHGLELSSSSNRHMSLHVSCFPCWMLLFRYRSAERVRISASACACASASASTPCICMCICTPCPPASSLSLDISPPARQNEEPAPSSFQTTPPSGRTTRPPRYHLPDRHPPGPGRGAVVARHPPPRLQGRVRCGAAAAVRAGRVYLVDTARWVSRGTEGGRMGAVRRRLEEKEK